MLRSSLGVITLSLSVLLTACGDPEAELKSEFIAECERSFLEDGGPKAESGPACNCIYNTIKPAATDEEFTIVLDFFKNSSPDTSERSLREGLGKDRYRELGKLIGQCEPS